MVLQERHLNFKAVLVKVGIIDITENRVGFDQLVGKLNVYRDFAEGCHVITDIINGSSHERGRMAGSNNKNIVIGFIRIDLVETACSNYSRKNIPGMRTNNCLHMLCGLGFGIPEQVGKLGPQGVLVRRIKFACCIGFTV